MDFTTLFEAVLTLVAVVITAVIVPYVKSKTTAEQQASISSWIDVAVAAAEQIFESGTGTEKLSYVQDFLNNLGYSVTVEEIESSVYWLTNAVTEGLMEVTADD